ncbi:MAG: isocitrate lyase/PEP mutase family protein [Gammaproteobacteria bacterium]|nr:isocitrate lyase/PEP mutase family protein [Gammaproteobacteria bacterium]
MREDNKRRCLRKALSADKPLIVVGAHDAMSACLIEHAGFEAVWVSGFGVSTMAHALPDLNLITMSEALAAARRINDATSLPVIADCDNGYGGLLNVVRTVKEYERAGIAGICVEDNLFPKRNSLFEGKTRRDLIPVEEQARRIEEGKRTQESDDFVFIARVEALIAGHGVDAACERADAYAQAGADAILMHSRDKTLKEIKGFLEAWTSYKRSIPLVAVPTLFPDFTADELHSLGFQVIIWANQLMRASVQAMEDTIEVLREAPKLSAADPSIASVGHIFDLVQTQETIDLEEGTNREEKVQRLGAQT